MVLYTIYKQTKIEKKGSGRQTMFPSTCTSRRHHMNKLFDYRKLLCIFALFSEMKYYTSRDYGL